MKISDLDLSERELRAMAIIFVSAMEHDWNDWFDGPDGMTGETKGDMNMLHQKLHFVFNNLGEEGLQKLLK